MNAEKPRWFQHPETGEIKKANSTTATLFVKEGWIEVTSKIEGTKR